jgi:tetratricopeptide (TPR) repeat protein
VKSKYHGGIFHSGLERSSRRLRFLQRTLRLLPYFIILLFPFYQHAIAQPFFDFPPPAPIELHQPLDGQTRMAMRNVAMAESRADYETALGIYLEIFQKYPEYSPFYDGCVRNFVFSGKYYDGLSWVDSLRKSYLNIGPANTLTAAQRDQFANIVVDCGRFLCRLSKRDEAFKRWDELFNLVNITINPYFRLFNAVTEARVPERLEEIVQKIRQVTHDPTMLASSLAEYWAGQGQVAKATSEYLRFMELQPRMADGIVGRILSLPESADDVLQVEDCLKKAQDSRTIRLQVTQILSSLYFRERRWEQAYQQMQIVDQMGDQSGVALLEYAEKLNSEDEYTLSSRVLDDLTKSRPNLIGNPRLLLAKAVSLEGNRQYQQADSVYNLLTSPVNVRNAMGQEALISQAELRLNRLHQPLAARKLLEDGLKTVPNLVKRFEATLLIGDTYLAEHNFIQAKTQYLEAASKTFGSDPTKRSRALTNVALVDFYTGTFAEAKNGLTEATRICPDQDLTNNALDIIDLIRAGESDSTSLTSFAKAMVEERLENNDAAFKGYSALVDQSKNGELVERAYWRLAELQLNIEKYQEAVQYLQSCQGHFPKSVRAPELLLKLGEIFVDQLGDRKRGAEIYEKILTDYPESLQVEEARQRLRKLETPQT